MLGFVPIQPALVTGPKIEVVRKISYRNNDHSLPLYRFHDSSALFFLSKMSCDVDGAPNAYNPSNDDLALDVIESAYGERRGDTPNGLLTVQPSQDVVVYADGVPYIQPDGEFKGFYVSKTTLENPSLPETDPARYLDPRSTQYIVLPEDLVPESKPGDLAVVCDTRTNKVAFAVFGDVGPSSESGEAALATLQRLGLPAVDGKSSPGEERNDFFYLVFPGTASELAEDPAWPHSQATIDRLGEKEFESWGGMTRLQAAESGVEQFKSTLSATRELRWL